LEGGRGRSERGIKDEEFWGSGPRIPLLLPPVSATTLPRILLPAPEARAIIAVVSGELKRGECLIRVKVRMNESLDQLLKRFKKACEKEGLTRDIKRTAFYEKPSEKRRRQERQLIRKMQKEANLR
jgi:small subunit ribosomal protein S21